MTTPFHKPNHTGELFSKLIKEVSHVHDFLAGPAMSEQDRLEREIAESNGYLKALTGRR